MAMSSSVLETNSPGPRLLVVDDNEDNRYTLTLQLEIEGYQNIAVAENGEEALELLQKQEFDLVLLDVMMPKLDGYQVTKWLRGNQATRHMPVILLTARVQEADIARGIAAGADDYVRKPFSTQELQERVQAALGR